MTSLERKITVMMNNLETPNMPEREASIANINEGIIFLRVLGQLKNLKVQKTT